MVFMYSDATVESNGDNKLQGCSSLTYYYYYKTEG